MDRRLIQTARKLSITAAALAVTVGVVLLMRSGARWFVDGGYLEVSGHHEPASPSRVFAPRVYDLAKLIPATLKLNLAGMALKSTSIRMPMPLELALKKSEADARADGWKELTVPLAFEFALLASFAKVYVTPDRRVIRRSHIALKGGETLREDLLLPAGDLLLQKQDMTLDEVVGLHCDEVRRLIPEPLASVVSVVKPLYTQFTTHGGEGASFMLVGLTPASTMAANAQIMSALRRNGWSEDADRKGCWTKSNLTASVNVSQRDEAMASDGSVAIFRFSDDEVLLTRKETEND